MEKRYCILVEWKNESCLVMEGKPMTQEKAMEALKRVIGNPRVIRAAVAVMEIVAGHEGLLPEPQPKEIAF